MEAAAARLRRPSAARSRNMAAIGPKNTEPELIVRRLLHAAGFRYRLHRTDLPGKPDIYLPKHRTVIEVHGCFWHSHDCHLFKQPRDNAEFWAEKLGRNRARDASNCAATAARGLRRLVVWQCAVMGRTRLTPEDLQMQLVAFICGSAQQGEIVGFNIAK